MITTKFRLIGVAVVLGIVLLVLLTGCGNLSPVASFTCTPTSGQSPLTVSFNASASHDPDGTIVTYQWTFGDGSNGTGATTSHTYTTTSNYTYSVTLTVTDDNGSQATATRMVSVTLPPPNSPPVASFAATPSSGEAPLGVSFNASGSSDSDGSITSYTWSFGDGNNGTGITVSHTYNDAGTYAAQLTVTDDDGATDTTTIQVEVSASSVPQDLYVDANNGSDATGDGTQGNPYQTITKAASVASGDAATQTVHVSAGVYNASLGESDPLLLSKIHLVGQDTDPTVVKIAVEITVISSSLHNVTLYRTVRTQGDYTEIYNCRVIGIDPGNGIMLGSREASVNHCYFQANQWALETSSGNASITNNTFSDNYCSISVDGGMAMISSNTIDRQGWGGYGVLAQLSTPSTIRIINNVITAPRNEFYASQGGSKIIIEGNSFAGTERLLYIIGTAAINIDIGGGNLGSSGNNSFTDGEYYVYDDRPPYSGNLFAKNDIWHDPQPSGTTEGPADSPPNCFIHSEGNSIIFSN